MTGHLRCFLRNQYFFFIVDSLFCLLVIQHDVWFMLDRFTLEWEVCLDSAPLPSMFIQRSMWKKQKRINSVVTADRSHCLVNWRRNITLTQEQKGHLTKIHHTSLFSRSEFLVKVLKAVQVWKSVEYKHKDLHQLLVSYIILLGKEKELQHNPSRRSIIVSTNCSDY